MRFPSSVPLFRLRGVSVRLHLALLLALPLFAYVVAHRMETVALVATLGDVTLLAKPWTWGALLAVGLLLSVLWHECAHAIAARAVGARVETLPLVALSGPPLTFSSVSTKREAVVVMAGPIASLLLGGAIGLAVFRHHFAFLDVELALGWLGEVQLALGLMELIPAPPLDGGRLLALALERRMPRPRATAVVAATGRVSAALAAIVGTLFGSALVLALAALIWAGSEAAARGAIVDGSLGRLVVGVVAIPPLCIDAGETLTSLARAMRQLRASAWAVSREGVLVGVVTAADVARIDPALRDSTRVGDVVRAVPTVAPATAASAALSTMRSASVRVLPVVEDGHLVGLVTDRALDAAGEIGELGAEVCLDLPSEGSSPAWRLRED